MNPPVTNVSNSGSSTNASGVAHKPKRKSPSKPKEKFDAHNRPKVNLEPGKIKTGDIMMFPYYGKVGTSSIGGNLLGMNGLEHGLKNYTVQGAELIKNSFSADYFGREEKVNQTDMIDILTVSYNRPFTVCWDKADKSERVLRGRLVGPDMRRGYSMVEDLDNAEGDRIRQVDHRGLKWMIVDGVKYILKK
jgi:hypothetical protein